MYLLKVTRFFLHKTKGKRLLICGDFNIDLIRSENSHDTNRFLDTVYCFGQYPLITKPTRITNRGATAIDNIFTNMLDDSVKNNVLIDDITDHLPVLCLLPNLRSDSTGISYRFHRKLTEVNLNAFKSMLDAKNWDEVYNIKNVNTAYEVFHKQFFSMYDICCPMTKSSERKRTDKPWLTKGLINACHKKNLLYKCQLSDKSDNVRHRYLMYKNKLTSSL